MKTTNMFDLRGDPLTRETIEAAAQTMLGNYGKPPVYTVHPSEKCALDLLMLPARSRPIDYDDWMPNPYRPLLCSKCSRRVARASLRFRGNPYCGPCAPERITGEFGFADDAYVMRKSVRRKWYRPCNDEAFKPSYQHGY